MQDKFSYAYNQLLKAIELNTWVTSECQISVRSLKFITEQLGLSLQKQPHYSTDTLLWACSLFYSSPSSYKTLRGRHLPHPDYIRKLKLTGVGVKEPGLRDAQVNYLKNKLSIMKEEKFINVLISKIHVKQSISYKAGTLQGSSFNSSGMATTWQAFMVSSILSSKKYVIALFPVRNLTAAYLFELTKKVIEVHEKSNWVQNSDYNFR